MGATVKKSLGSLLLDNGLVTEQELDHALSLQTSCQSPLGKILVGEGAINNYTLYHTLAQQHEIPFVDLTQEPGDSSLLNHEARYHYIALGSVDIHN